MDILMAFQRCIEKKPIDTISLRDIAAEAGMSHPKLLHYFDSKDDLILTYVRYTKDYMTEHCMTWFATHDRKDYDSNLAFLNDFMHYVAEAPEGELRPNATTQTYVLGHYKEEMGRW
ncbi:MAG: TetR/AcrR family transcriptional regulator [Oscillospiraceae bacterium]|nr:TetR/AcrR family transcriptional regulator [Oscillospiraceae bacterium]